MCPLGNLGIEKNVRKDNALMKQGSKFTARREKNKREEEQERENESHQRR